MSKTPLFELNNWVGLEKGPSWEGLARDQPHPRFAKFVDPVYSIRAGAITLRNYWRRHSVRTISGAIARWAPANENPTQSYIERVARHVGIGPHDPIPVLTFDIVVRMLTGIVATETGMARPPRSKIERGVIMAGFEVPKAMSLGEAARTDTGVGAATGIAATTTAAVADRLVGADLSDEFKLVIIVTLALATFIAVLAWRARRR